MRSPPRICLSRMTVQEGELRRAWGRNIRSGRRSQGLSQRELSIACGVEQSTVSRWERAEVVPTEDHKLLIARALRAEARALFPLTEM